MSQVNIETRHTIHAGVYARTIIIPAGVLITGALIKIPTLVIFSGHAVIYNDCAEEFSGYHLFTAAAGRKTAFLAIAETALTMLFSTQAQTVEEAEREFTDEFDMLITRREVC